MRPSKIDDVTKRDAFLSAWSSEDQTLSFMDLVRHSHKQDLIFSEKQHSMVSLWLRKLQQEKAVRKTRDGYQLILKPDEYRLFNNLNVLRKKYETSIFRGEVGGSIWKSCALSILGLPKEPLKDKDVRIAFNILLVRLGAIFSALEKLRNVLAKRAAGLPTAIDRNVDREVFFALLNKNIGQTGTTEELVQRYMERLAGLLEYREYFGMRWSRTCENRSVMIRNLQELSMDTQHLKQVCHNIRKYKNQLKKEGFHVDKHQLEGPYGLVARYKTLRGRAPSPLRSDKEDDEKSKLSLAILIKVAENLKKLNVDLDDFAIVLSHHPVTMPYFFTAEHVLYDAMKWATEEPTDEWLRTEWVQQKKMHENVEAVIAQYLIDRAYFSVEDYSQLRSRPWILKKLAKNADFEKILQIYGEKLSKQSHLSPPGFSL